MVFYLSLLDRDSYFILLIKMLLSVISQEDSLSNVLKAQVFYQASSWLAVYTDPHIPGLSFCHVLLHLQEYDGGIIKF